MQRHVSEGKAKVRRVLVVLPFDMSVRNFVTSRVATLLASEEGLEVKIVSREPKDGEQIARLTHGRVGWAQIQRPFRHSVLPGIPVLRRLRLLLADGRLAVGHYLFLSLVFRFNSIAGFRGFSDKLKQSRPLRRLAYKEGLPSRRWLGFPFAGSKAMFAAMQALYLSRWQRHVQVEELFNTFRPDALVITHLQTSVVTPYVLAATAREVPVLGVNGSWDQPTTKGPMLPGVAHVLAQSQQVVDDLETHHGFGRARAEVVGWPQMDVYADRSRMVPRAAFLAGIGLAPNARYVLFAAYSERLGQHEPQLCRELQGAIASGAFGPDAVLYVRSHPLDRDWRERLGSLASMPITVVEAPDLGTLDHLTNLIRHAEVVVASAGTINLDAVALDTPSIALAFEDSGVPYFDSAARRYDMEHVAAVMACGGIRCVKSLEELVGAIKGYMANRALDAEGRALLRQRHLDPLDGRAAERTAAAIKRFAGAAGDAGVARSDGAVMSTGRPQ